MDILFKIYGNLHVNLHGNNGNPHYDSHENPHGKTYRTPHGYSTWKATLNFFENLFKIVILLDNLYGNSLTNLHGKTH